MALIRNSKDFLSGLMFMAFGIAALVLSGDYTIGTAARMGPGYFPRVLGILLLGLGALLALGGLRATSEKQPVWHWKPLFIVLCSVGAFILVGQRLGLVLASLILVFIASLASDEFSWKEALLSGLIQGVVAVVVFVYGLALPLPVWPVFVTGIQ
jgi:hypothetical protein